MSRRYGRRQFFAVAASVSAAAWLAACGGATESGSTTSDTPRGAAVGTPEPIEKPKLIIGYIPITCIAPLVMAAPLGFYKKYGLDVTLKKYPGPPQLRDAFIAGEMDAGHLLLPMPIALNLGLGSAKVATRVAVSQNLNGQAITLANKHRGTVNGPMDLRGKVIAVPFDFSMHNLLLRHYLAQGGVNPDTDLEIRLLRAPDMVAALATGNIDGYLGPDPVNQRAVHEKVGFITLLSKEIWDGHPCCAFSVKEEFRTQYPATYRALVRALVDAAVWSNNAANREQIADAIAPEEYLNQPVEVVRAVLTGRYDNGAGQTFNVPNRLGFDPFPWQSFGTWMGTQIQRWGYAKGNEFASPASYKQIASEVFLTEDVRAALKSLNLDAPSTDSKTETILGKTFNPDNPLPWTQRVVA